jgi:hypothetical protein
MFNFRCTDIPICPNKPIDPELEHFLETLRSHDQVLIDPRSFESVWVIPGNSFLFIAKDDAPDKFFVGMYSVDSRQFYSESLCEGSRADCFRFTSKQLFERLT